MKHNYAAEVIIKDVIFSVCGKASELSMESAHAFVIGPENQNIRHFFLYQPH